jgi:hypothetical protein
MDEIVKAALKKWPNVPHCYGWLALDARGDWYMRDDRVQAAGPFPQVKGSRILHDKLREFIHRNYDADDAGRWFFQNGPQRVYVELEAAPWIWRVDSAAGGFTVASHTDVSTRAQDAWLDEQGRLFLLCELGFGLVHTLDTGVAAQAIDAGAWPLRGELAFAQMPERFGYVLSPAHDTHSGAATAAP